MSARITWILAGIAAAAGIIAWLAFRGGPERHPARTGAGGDVERAVPGDAGSTHGPRRSFPRPTRLVPPPGAPPPPQVAEFDSDARDDAWADDMQRQLATRLAPLGIQTTAIDCRSRSCRLEVTAADLDALSAAISRLGEPGGLVGLADGMVVSAPEPLSDGSAVRANAYAEFDR